MDVHFAWQAWHLWHWAGSGGTLVGAVMAGVALGDIDLHFSLSYDLTSTTLLRIPNFFFHSFKTKIHIKLHERTIIDHFIRFPPSHASEPPSFTFTHV